MRLANRLKELQQERDELAKSGGTTLVMRETKKPRDAFVLIRGNYERKGEKVERATPASLPPMGKDLPRDRLGFAMRRSV